MTSTFTHLIILEPLGLLYGSAGRFLSPENLVGRSGTQFPPSAATLSGLLAAALGNEAVQTLQLAGPFWAKTHQPQAPFVPTPFHLLAQMNPAPDADGFWRGQVQQRLAWHPGENPGHDDGRWQAHPMQSAPTSGDTSSHSSGEAESTITSKPTSDTWMPLADWDNPTVVYAAPWQFLPHLHPRLKDDERHVAETSEGQGSLFLENSVQLHPDVGLVYLSNLALDEGWYRFGGEGHLVDLHCHPIPADLSQRLALPLGHSFALLTHGLWGSNRFSHRYPEAWEHPPQALLTQRAIPVRHRLGGPPGQPKRLSRGRYAVPAGTVYIMPDEFPPWPQWDETWFATESRPAQNRTGFTTKRWGCGLALPIPEAIAA